MHDLERKLRNNSHACVRTILPSNYFSLNYLSYEQEIYPILNTQSVSIFIKQKLKTTSTRILASTVPIAALLPLLSMNSTALWTQVKLPPVQGTYPPSG